MGRYHLQLHSVLTSCVCETPDCSCDCAPSTQQDGTAVLTITGAESDFLLTDGAILRDEFLILSGSLNAPTIDLGAADTPGMPHNETYSDTFGVGTFYPFWYASGNADTISAPVTASTPPCGGGTPCSEDTDTVTVTFDQHNWNITAFHRKYHQDGICGEAIFTTEQTGTGWLECADE